MELTTLSKQYEDTEEGSAAPRTTAGKDPPGHGQPQLSKGWTPSRSSSKEFTQLQEEREGQAVIDTKAKRKTNRDGRSICTLTCDDISCSVSGP